MTKNIGTEGNQSQHTRRSHSPFRLDFRLDFRLALGLVVLLFAACDCDATPPATSSGPCTISSECLITEACVDGMCRETEPVETGCTVDVDGDGYGEGCNKGPDCDDTNTTQTGFELCDGADNDCDGVADNGVLSECGTCDAMCRRDGSGGDDDPFDVEMNPSEGVSVGEDGALRLDSQRVATHFIWIANTGEGTVSKFDTRTYVEVARYATGSGGRANDPSRTSVNSLGDVYVGNRRGLSVTKISALGDECADTNGDGVVTTSTGGADVLAWGMDDCVLWNTPLPGGGLIRAVAAQDVEGLDFSIDSDVWIGGYGGTIWKLDGDTGDILVETEGPITNYGFALDGMGNLWISGLSANALGRVDTTRCTSTAACAEAACETDDCMKQRIPMPHLTYGITVDADQRVWTANYSARSVTRYDHSAAPASRLVTTSVGASCHGIAADGAGWVWAACSGSGVARLDGDDPSMWQFVAGTEGFSCKGMAVDFDQKIWSINISHNSAIVIEPGASLTEAVVTTNVAESIVSPYTYSDMTGQQLRLATNPRGYYRRILEGCDDDPNAPVRWGDLSWTADVPPGTSLVFRVRTAADRAALDLNDEWVVVAEVPPATSPASVRMALADAGVMSERFLEIEVIFQSTRASTSEVITPALHAFETSHYCNPAIL